MSWLRWFSLLAAGVCLAQNYSMEGVGRYVAARDWQGLLRYTEAWTRSRPNDPDAWFNLGATYLNGFNQPANAVAPLRRSVELNPRASQAWFFLGSAYRKIEQYDNAIDAFRHATNLDPGHLNNWLGLAGAYEDRNYASPTASAENTAVVEALKRGEAAASPSTNATAWYDLGLAFDGAGAAGNAADAYSRAIRLAPNAAEAWNNRGVDEEKLGQSQRALADYDQAFRLGDRTGGENAQKLRAAIAAGAAQRASGCPSPPGFTTSQRPPATFAITAFCRNHPGCNYVFNGGVQHCR